MFRRCIRPRVCYRSQSVIESQSFTDLDTGYVVRKDIDLTKIKLPDAKMTDLALQLKAGEPLDKVPVGKVVNESAAKRVAKEIEPYNPGVKNNAE